MREMTHEGWLRAGARKGESDPFEAATELLIRAFGGKYAQPGNPWVEHPDSPAAYINFEAIPEHVDEVENQRARQVLMLAASLSDLDVKVSLGDLLYELDREVLDLVLAAVAHAASSDDYEVMVEDPDGTVYMDGLPSLHPWPTV